MLKPIEDVRITRVAGDWSHSRLPAADVGAHWQAVTAANPALWNGRVLGTRAPGWPGGLTLENGVLAGEAVEGDFSTFLAWRDWGFPEVGLRNLFGSAVIMSADGALIYGVMGDETANAGRVYPPGGSLEPSDCDEAGHVGVIASIERELYEETGLVAAEARIEGLYAIFDGPRVSVARVHRFDLPADELVAKVMDNLDRQEERELARVVAIRAGEGGRYPSMMPYARLIIETLLG
jgi:8-oxo-dGTP pyrophosphatase MutT (NUDIX family)